MSTVLTPATLAAEERFVLRDVSWATYEQLLTNYAEHSAPRFTYDEGVLEIMSPSSTHETASETLRQIVYAIVDSRELDAKGLGSTTYRRHDLLKGVEPDGCFYIQTVERIRKLSEIDIADFPPDLVIEVDVSNPSLDRFPIYAALGVPEIWHYADERVSFRQLNAARDNYNETATSVCLKGITAEAVTRFVAESRTLKRPAWLKSLRAWLDENR